MQSFSKCSNEPRKINFVVVPKAHTKEPNLMIISMLLSKSHEKPKLYKSKDLTCQYYLSRNKKLYKEEHSGYPPPPRWVLSHAWDPVALNTRVNTGGWSVVLQSLSTSNRVGTYEASCEIGAQIFLRVLFPRCTVQCTSQKRFIYRLLTQHDFLPV